MKRSLLLTLAVSWMWFLTNGQTCSNNVLSEGPCNPYIANICNAGVLDAELITDGDPSTFGMLEVKANVLEKAFVKVELPNLVRSGRVLNLLLGTPLNLLNSTFLKTINIKVFDENGVVVYEEIGLNLLNIRSLPGSFGDISVNLPIPYGDFMVSAVQIELGSLADLTNRLRVYSLCLDEQCLSVPVNQVINSNLGINIGNLLDLNLNNITTLQTLANGQSDAYLTLELDKIISGDVFLGLRLKDIDQGLSNLLFANIKLELLDANSNLIQTVQGLTPSDLFPVQVNLSGFLLGTTVNLNGQVKFIRVVLSPVVNDVLELNLCELVVEPLLDTLDILVNGGTNILCDSAGIVLTAQPGFTNYQWSNGLLGQTINAVKGGLYSVTAETPLGCTVSSSFYVLESILSAVLDSNLSQMSNCDGSGILALNITGGSGDITVNWSNGMSGSIIENLSAGIYTANIIDNLTGCSISVDFIVGDSNGPDVETFVKPASCQQADGAIVITPRDNRNYTYVWGHDPNHNSPIASSIGAGDYSVTVIDESGCKSVHNFRVPAEGDFELSAEIQKADCFGGNGAIDLTVGLPGNYSFLWNTGDTTEDLSDLTAGVYTVVVTNDVGCEDQASFAVSEEGGPEVTLVDLQNVTCGETDNGRIEISIPFGTVAQWSDGPVGTVRENLTPGQYVVEVTNTPTPCRTIEIYTIEDDGNIVIGGDIQDECTNIAGKQGKISLEVFGGTPPFTYAWSNGANSDEIENLEAGTYTVYVTDSTGCTDSATFIVGERACSEDEFDLFIPQLMTPNSDGFNDFFEIKGIEAFPNNKLTIYNRHGRIVFEKNSYQNEFDGKFQPTGEMLDPDTYFYTLDLNDNEDRKFKGFIVIRY